MSANEDHLRRFVFWQRLRSLHNAEYDELLQFLDDLATDADPEMKTAVAFYVRHLRFICQMHCTTLEKILTSTKDQRIHRLAEPALAADDFRPHRLYMAAEAVLEKRYKRGWQYVKGCLPWKDCEHKRQSSLGGSP